MGSKSFAKSLNYKLRELELILKQFNDDTEPERIDIDLALDKTRELYNLLLKHETGRTDRPFREEQRVPSGKQVVPSDPDSVKSEEVFEPEDVIPDPDKSRPEKTSAGEEKTGQKAEKPDPVQDKSAEKEKSVKDNEIGPGQEQTEISEKGKGEKQNGTRDIEIVADRYQVSQNYINKIMADKQAKKDLTAKQQSKPITDLRKSIGLNEKFLFIKELFKGRPDQYNQCIDILNESSSYEDSLNYINSNFSWEKDSEIVEKFLNLVKRKHQVE